MNGSPHPGAGQPGESSTPDLPQIITALQSIYEPRTSNAQRQSATSLLETIKADPAAPQHGFSLASDQSQPAIARHYGLSLLEHAIRYRLDDFTGQECETIKSWVVQLAENVREDEPVFLRSKVARLWVDLAERNWGLDWMDLDENLVKLWSGAYVHQELVLYVLETMADEVFNNESSGAASLRSNELGKACIDIFTPAEVLARVFPDRETGQVLRCGDEGWFHRLLDMLERCLNQDWKQQNQVHNLLIKVLGVLQSTVPWIILRAVSDSNCLSLVSGCLTSGDVPIQMGAVEVLHSLYHRAPWPEDGIQKLVCPVLSTDGLALLKSIYESACCESDDIDDEKYTMLKKFTEMVCALVTFWETRPKLISECDVGGILNLLVGIMQNPSLVVSIPIVYLWTRLLAVRQVVDCEEIMQIVGPLLEISSRRLMRYESLPTDSQDPTVAFLNEDFDTMPERHAFLGNYRRFCIAVIEKIVYKAPFEAVRHILSQADDAITNLYSGQHAFKPETFSVNSAPVLRVDAQSTVVMTALKSYQKWIAGQRAKGKQHAAESSSFEAAVMQWSKALLQKDFPDPIIRKRIFQLVVEIATLGLSPDPDLCLTICTAVFSMSELTTSNINIAYDEAVKDLQATYPRELQKMAPFFCDDLFVGYPYLEAGVNKKNQDSSLEERIQLDYQAFLFIIIQRTTRLSSDERLQRLNTMLQPAVSAWQQSQIDDALQNFQSFSRLLHIEQFPHVFLNHGASRIDDWSSESLKPDELKLRLEIHDSPQMMPLQATRSLLSVSTERLRIGSTSYQAAQALWKDAIPIVVPNLLRALSFSHAFANPETWSDYPPEMRTIIGRILVDRVWQSGISNETKDDFYNRVRNSKGSLEGMASAVRGAIRGVREVAYWILHCISILGDVFYCHSDLAQVLADSLYNDARFLSPNQLMSLLKLSTALIDGCPPQYRPSFLPPLLTALFRELDVKVTSEWEALIQKGDQAGSDEALDQEMKAESILRHLTHASVTLISTNVLLKRPPEPSTNGESGNGHTINGQDDNGDKKSTDLRSLVLANPQVLEVLLMFCNHALRMRDSRCCGVVTRVLRSLIPEFAEHAPKAVPSTPTNGIATHASSPLVDPTLAAQLREFFCSTLLPTTILSLHDPYFAADPSLQKDLAVLIAAILATFSTSTPTPRNVLLSLPEMTESKVDNALKEITGTASERTQRGWVLKLLDSVRGVSIYDVGKVVSATKPKRRKEMDYMMSVEDQPEGTIARGPSPELGGVADLFG